MALLSRFDLVWPLERGDEGLSALAHTLGWPSAVTRNALKLKAIAPRHNQVHGDPIDHAAQEMRLCGAKGCGELSPLR